MGVHMTLRCIAGGEIYNQEYGPGGCEGNSLDIAAGGTRQSVLESAERLFSLARQAGWRHCPQGWICPDCSRQGEEIRPAVQAVHRLICQVPGITLAGIARAHRWPPGIIWRNKQADQQARVCHLSRVTVLISGKRHRLPLKGGTFHPCLALTSKPPNVK